MKIAVIYARYSSDKQTEQSIEGQLRVCYDYAERNNIKVVKTFIDRAMSGTNDNRADFQKMMKESNKKAWDIILVYKLDRFSRNKYETAMHKKTLRDNGIKLVSAMENIPDTPEGIILESLLEGMAEYYSAELAQKVKRGMNETRHKGEFTGGVIEFGYKVENKKVIVDEFQAKIVNHVYEQYANNVTVNEIIKELLDKGILNKGKPFAKTTIHRMLENEKYTGIYRYKDEVFTNIYPQIISNVLFNLVHMKKIKNKNGKTSLTNPYLLRKLIKCGYCGKSITGISGGSEYTLVRYYACSSHYTKKGCNKKSIRKDVLEDVIKKTLVKTFSSKKTIDEISERIIEKNLKKIEDQSILKLLEQQCLNIVNAKNNVIKAIEMGIITDSTRKKLIELENEQKELENKIVIEKSRDKLLITKEDISTFFKTALENKIDILIDRIIKEIILYDDKIIIHCNYSNQKNTNEDLLISEITKKIPISNGTKSGIEYKDTKIQIYI